MSLRIRSIIFKKILVKISKLIVIIAPAYPKITFIPEG